MTFQTITVTPGTGATINKLAPAGQNTMANSLSVVIAPDQSPVATTGDIPSGVVNSGNPIQNGAIAITQERGAVIHGQRIGLVADVTDKLINIPCANEVRGLRQARPPWYRLLRRE